MHCSSLYSHSDFGLRAGMLSPGELQRLSVARVLLHQPLLAVIDEPVSAVGSRTGIELLQLLQSHNIAAIVTCQADSALINESAMRENLFAKTVYL